MTIGEAFRTGGLEIHSSGVTQDGAEHQFSVVYEDLEIAEVIGRGCSSVVLRARHVGTDRPLALKVINMFEKGKRHQLINEINALYDASHPTVIQFLGAFYREGAVTIITEYMDGGSLLNVLQQVGAVPERALSSVAYQVLLALDYLKRGKRIVHRDIKPSNLLINSQGVVKVTDFGTSAGLQSSFAMCGTFVGTFKYMSPERMKSERYSYSSDVWSLGLVLMECATGEFPYRDETTAIDLVQTIVDAPAPELDPSSFPAEFCSFVADCLRKRPDDRSPAQALLGAPWITGGGLAVNLNADLVSATANVKRWIDSPS
ncbi:Mitogen-activated protein kinase kinase (MAP2K) [Ectocarpus siliculosus]|uniref:mitogen-activated protein kinase kinase n=1 Tax=Ectocarpus siliculosus TaxID=2880 RepID=D8LNV1_ECTSI|nr:Mitogen-activated protein kinase kinase (MAP2K) [Ectocarpus siliculosus]|eukprot:CBN78311.1 Mitogen-activated protein kinase kinase (MAP2K) [Ectocarpus siliculosus]